jgi:hypothetical protein
MTTTQITWHKPDNLPDAQTNVLIALNVDGIRTSCEGFIDSSPHAPSTDADGAPNDDGMQWYDVTAEPLDHRHVVAWASLPEGPEA